MGPRPSPSLGSVATALLALAADPQGSRVRVPSFMADEPSNSPKAKPPPRVAKPGELLFEFCREHDHKFFRCELRDHGRIAVEAQFLRAGISFLSRPFEDVDDGSTLRRRRRSRLPGRSRSGKPSGGIEDEREASG